MQQSLNTSTLGIKPLASNLTASQNKAQEYLWVQKYLEYNMLKRKNFGTQTKIISHPM